jgi:molecular chaperone GrpE
MSTDPQQEDFDPVLELGGESALDASGDAFAGDRIARLENDLAAAEKNALRHQAELENSRRRMRRESEELVRYALGPLMLDVLEGLDNLDRALQVRGTAPSAADSSLASGVAMVAQQLNQALAGHGCIAIEAAGQPFDPQLHQAVQMLPSADVPANHVLQVLRAGYRLHDRVLRPAQVIVSTG